MTQAWKRPKDLSVPVQYYKFVTRDKDSEKLVEYRVEDIPHSRYEEACRFMVEHFVPHEPKLVARNGQNDPQLLEDYFNKYMSVINQEVSVACFKKDCTDFIGVNILEVAQKGLPHDKFEMKSKICVDNSGLANYVRDKADIFSTYGVEYFLSGTGLAIDNSYHGRGIATEMIKARETILELLKLKVCSTGFSSIGAQKAAIKAGYTVDYSISYKDLAKINADWDFSESTTKNCVQMSFVNNFQKEK